MVIDFQGVKWRPSFVAENDLHAYVDGSLDPADRPRVEAYLSVFPEERERVEAYRRQNVLLHRLYDVPAMPARYHVQARSLSRALARGRRVRAATRVAVAASVAVLAVVGAWAGYERVSEPPDNPLTAFTRQATEAHMMLVGEGFPKGIAVAREQDNSAVLGWLSDQGSGMPGAPPDFADHGFSLLGARVLPTGQGAAVQLLYGNDDDRRVTLFMGPSLNDHRTASTVIEDGDVTLVYWQVGESAYSLIGNVGRKTLLALAGTVSESVSTRRSARKPLESPPAPGAGAPSRAAPAPDAPRDSRLEPGLTKTGTKPET